VVVPEADLGERLLHCDVEVRLLEPPRRAVQAKSEDDVLVDGQRQRVRPLKNHAHRFSQLHQRHVGVVDVLAEHDDLTFRRHVPVPLVDPIEAAQERRLAAPRRANEGSDEPLFDFQLDILESLELRVPEAEIFRRDAQGERLRRRIAA